MRLAPQRGVHGWLQHAWFLAAFWTALLLFTRKPASRGCKLRFATGLAAGAWLAHLGWVLQHLDRLAAPPLLPAAGFSVLFLPFGPLLVAPWRAPASVRESYLASSLPTLPPALAVARLGCLSAGCCGGLPIEAPWFATWRHPTPVYEILGLLALAGATRRVREIRRAGSTLVGLGLLRLAVEPLRAPAPLGTPLIATEALAVLWVAVGAASGVRRAFRGGDRPG